MGRGCSTKSNYMGGWLAKKRHINVFDVPTCPTISPVVGHSNIVGPLLSTWGNCRKQIPAILDDIKLCKALNIYFCKIKKKNGLHLSLNCNNE